MAKRFAHGFKQAGRLHYDYRRAACSTTTGGTPVLLPRNHGVFEQPGKLFFAGRARRELGYAVLR